MDCIGCTNKNGRWSMKKQLFRVLTTVVIISVTGLFSCGGGGSQDNAATSGSGSAESNANNPQTPRSINIPLQIKETLGITRTSEMVHNGIPISKDHQLTSTDELIIETENGTQIPATFEILSRWAGGKNDQSKYIQWLLVSFPVSIDANADALYYLTTGTPIAKSNIITLSNNSDNYTIDTGSAEFVIDKNSMTFFRSISANGSVVLSGDGESSSTINGQPEALAEAPTITIEESNEHYLCIKLEGDYANEPVGYFDDMNNRDHRKPISYRIRYEFFAGSPTVIVNHKFYWSGRNRNEHGSGNRQVNIASGLPITVDNVSLTLPAMNSYSSTEIFADSGTQLSGSLSGSDTGSIAQRLRDPFANPHTLQIELGSNTQTTEFAEQPMLINKSSNGSIAVSIDHMKYFEPQSIETDSDGKIKINVMSENQYFSSHQGTWARVGISALPSDATYTDTLTQNYAPLNHRLFAFPTSEYTHSTKVFFEHAVDPDISSNQLVQKYYNEMTEITDASKTYLENERYHGLMSWGTMPRYAGEDGEGTEWDKIYSGANVSDYHSAWNNVVYQFIYEGDPSNLYDLSFMGARRMLHTQIIQPDEEVSDTYMGWAPGGYDRYRIDFNSSHSYFENLYSYYYLTGDKEVIDILKVAGENTRPSYTREDDSSLNDQDTGGVNYINHAGRVGSQAALVYNFLGHTYDESFLDDFKHMYNHVFSRFIVLLGNGDGKEYGFMSYQYDTSSGFATGQAWMNAYYPLQNIYILYNEYGDITLGSTNLSISRVYEAIANGYYKYTANVCNEEVCGSGRIGNGTWSGPWANSVTVNYTGNKIGGTIESVEPTPTGDPMLYSGGKAILTALMYRAGGMGNDQQLTDFATEGVTTLLNSVDFDDAEDDLWSKINALYFNRLHHSMDYMDGE